MIFVVFVYHGYVKNETSSHILARNIRSSTQGDLCYRCCCPCVPGGTHGMLVGVFLPGKNSEVMKYTSQVLSASKYLRGSARALLLHPFVCVDVGSLDNGNPQFRHDANSKERVHTWRCTYTWHVETFSTLANVKPGQTRNGEKDKRSE